LSRTASPCIVAGYNFAADNFIFPDDFDYSTDGFTTIAGYFAEVMTQAASHAICAMMH
jgi:hypothetical protein